MNGKTAKLLRKVATLSEAPLQDLKRSWYGTPAPERHRARLKLKDQARALAGVGE